MEICNISIGYLYDIYAQISELNRLFVLCIGYVGAILGSLGYVLISDSRDIYSKILGRSRCDDCGHILYIADLVPIWSYIFLDGKCRYCKSDIDSGHIYAELVMMVCFVLIYICAMLGGWSILTIYICYIVGWTSVCICIYDRYHFRLNIYMYLVGLLAYIGYIYISDVVYIDRYVVLIGSIVWGLVYILGYIVSYIKSRSISEGFGLGDFLLGIFGSLVVASIYPDMDIGSTFLFIYIWVTISALLGLIGSVFGYKKMIAFLPYMYLGRLCTVFLWSIC